MNHRSTNAERRTRAALTRRHVYRPKPMMWQAKMHALATALTEPCHFRKFSLQFFTVSYAFEHADNARRIVEARARSMHAEFDVRFGLRALTITFNRRWPVLPNGSPVLKKWTIDLVPPLNEQDAGKTLEANVKVTFHPVQIHSASKCFFLSYELSNSYLHSTLDLIEFEFTRMEREARDFVPSSGALTFKQGRQLSRLDNF